jgi:hypothetical protein
MRERSVWLKQNIAYFILQALKMNVLAPNNIIYVDSEI